MKDIEAVDVKVSTFLTLTVHGHSKEFHIMAIFILQRRVHLDYAEGMFECNFAEDSSCLTSTQHHRLVHTVILSQLMP
jgi:hypothetical protein